MKCKCMINDADYDRNEPIIFCDLHKAAPKLLKALKHAYDRLNALPHNYDDTNFKLIQSALKEAEGK